MITLNNELNTDTGINTARCYQCGKCSAGCPLANDMDIRSSSVLRMLQSEEKELDAALLRSHAIWLCVSCETCLTRCPMQIDIPKIMDFLRQKSIEQGVQHPSANREIVSFHRSFLDVVRLTGRSYEIGLIAGYKLRSKKFLQDLLLAPKMLNKGKLPIIPERIKNRKDMIRIFKKSKKQ